MKKIFILLCFYLLPFVASADVGVNYYGGGQGSTAGCASETYLFNWDGNYLGDTDKGCFTNGGANKDGTQSGGTLVTGQFTVTAHNEYVTWTVTGSDGFDSDGNMTVYVQVNIDTVTAAERMSVFESYKDANHSFNVIIMEDRTLRCRWEGDGSAFTSDSGSSISEETDVWVGCSMDIAGDELSASINGGSSWDDDVDAITTWSQDAVNVVIGEKDAETGNSFDDTGIVKEVYVLSGHKTAKP
jgi:hypothetical protein